MFVPDPKIELQGFSRSLMHSQMKKFKTLYVVLDQTKQGREHSPIYNGKDFGSAHQSGGDAFLPSAAPLCVSKR